MSFAVFPLLDTFFRSVLGYHKLFKTEKFANYLNIMWSIMERNENQIIQFPDIPVHNEKVAAILVKSVHRILRLLLLYYSYVRFLPHPRVRFVCEIWICSCSRSAHAQCMLRARSVHAPWTLCAHSVHAPFTLQKKIPRNIFQKESEKKKNISEKKIWINFKNKIFQQKNSNRNLPKKNFKKNSE